MWCRKAAVVQAIAAERALDPRDPLVLASRVAVGDVTVALHDLPVLDPVFAALAAPPGQPPLATRYWSIDDQGTLQPCAAPHPRAAGSPPRRPGA